MESTPNQRLIPSQQMEQYTTEISNPNIETIIIIENKPKKKRKRKFTF